MCAVEPGALFESTILILDPLPQRCPAIDDMLAARGQFVLHETPGEELAHACAQALVERFQPSVRVDEQRETPQLTKQLPWPIVGGARDARHTSQSSSDTGRLGVHHARGLRFPEAGGPTLQRPDAIAD